jgi:hypothetical protein
MTSELILAPPPPESREEKPLALTSAEARLRKRVLDAVVSPIPTATMPRPSMTSSPSLPASLSPGPY